MDDDDVGVRRGLPERRGNGILPAGASFDETHRFARVRRQIRRRIFENGGRKRDDQLVDRRMRHEQRHAPLEDRTPAELEQLLGLRVTESLTASAGRKNR